MGSKEPLVVLPVLQSHPLQRPGSRRWGLENLELVVPLLDSAAAGKRGKN